MAVSAIKRAKTEKCRTKIETAACFYKNLFETTDRFDFVRLESTCPFLSQRNVTLLCQIQAQHLADEISQNNLRHEVMVQSPLMEVKLCRDICLTAIGFPYFAFSPTGYCVCLESLSKTMLQRNALTDRKHICYQKRGKHHYNIFSTGYFGESSGKGRSLVSVQEMTIS